MGCDATPYGIGNKRTRKDEEKLEELPAVQRLPVWETGYNHLQWVYTFSAIGLRIFSFFLVCVSSAV